LAENKFLAKVASDLRKPDGFVIVPTGEQAAREFLSPLPVSRLWGVGPKTCERLNKLGFFTVGQIAQADPEMLARRIGDHLAGHLQALSIGADSREVERGERPKSIGRENTFAADLHGYQAMERELLYFADDVSARLRRKGLRCRGMTLKVKFGDFTRISRAASFEEPTDLAEPLYKAAVQLLRKSVSLSGRGVRLLGIAATRLEESGQTTSLFPDVEAGRQRDVATAVDRLRERFGEEAITRATLLEGREKTTGTPSESPPS
jgi:DNA polymerase-4